MAIEALCGGGRRVLFLKEKNQKNFNGKGYGYRGFVRWGDACSFLERKEPKELYWQGIMAIGVLCGGGDACSPYSVGAHCVYSAV